jgi:hypothetical protein
MSKPEYDVLRIEGSSNRVEVLMRNCDHVTAYDLSSCISDHPGYIWTITPAGSIATAISIPQPQPSTKGGQSERSAVRPDGSCGGFYSW